MGCCPSENAEQPLSQEDEPGDNTSMEFNNDLDNYNLSDMEVAMNKEDIPNDQTVNTLIQDNLEDLEEYDTTYRHAKIDGNNSFPYDPTTGTITDDWKLRKFHSTIYDHRLVNLMESKENNYLVIDVRDPSLDYPGGHIKTAINIYHEDFINKLPFIIKEYNDKSNVIIHCMYSQSRGPMCCQWYCLALECLLKNHNKNKDEKNFAQCIEQNTDFEILQSISFDNEIYQNLLNQNVLLLKGGFRHWLNKYKDDNKYVEDFAMEYWQYEKVGGKRELYHKTDW